MEERSGLYEVPKEVLDKFTPISEKEGCIHILQGLISYHERMTMGNYPERDFYLRALRFALECVEKEGVKGMSGEGCLGILKGLLGFQKRMRMAEVYGDQGQLCGNTQECAEGMKADLYMEALEEAIRCVEIVHGIGSECAE